MVNPPACPPELAARCACGGTIAVQRAGQCRRCYQAAAYARRKTGHCATCGRGGLAPPSQRCRACWQAARAAGLLVGAAEAGPSLAAVAAEPDADAAVRPFRCPVHSQPPVLVLDPHRDPQVIPAASAEVAALVGQLWRCPVPGCLWAGWAGPTGAARLEVDPLIPHPLMPGGPAPLDQQAA